MKVWIEGLDLRFGSKVWNQGLEQRFGSKVSLSGPDFLLLVGPELMKFKKYY